MKLKTALQIGAVFPILMAILVVLGLVIRAQESQKVVASFGQIDRLVENTGELNRLTRRYVLRGDEGVVGAWYAKHSSIQRILDHLRSVKRLDGGVVESLQTTHTQLRDLFTQLTGDKLGDARRDIAVDDLFQGLVDVSTDAFALAASAHAHAFRAQTEADMVVAPLFGVLALAIAGGILVTGRVVLQKFDVVSEGIAAASKGDFDHWAKTTRQRARDPLSDAFSKMSKRLKVSQVELKKEANKHEQSADALRKTNVLLSDALVKLKRAQKQAVDTERLKALTQVSGGITHSFNNCLAPVLALSDYLLARPEALENHAALKDNLQTINEAALRAREQVFRLSDFFGSRRTVVAGSVELNKIVEESVQATEPMWKAQAEAHGTTITVKTMLSGLPKLKARADSMRELMACLIFNSVEAMPRGGTITITTRDDSGRITLVVEDTGDGMTDEVSERACEPFFSTKSDQSAGMGLAIVSGIVRSMDGTFEIDSVAGTGTKTTVSFPVAAETWGDSQDKPRPADPKEKLGILIIDDEPWIRSSLTKILSAEGHRVEAAATGSEGLEKLGAGEFDVLFQDQALPGGSTGVEIAKQAKSVAPDLHIILLTGFASDFAGEDNLPEGIDLVLSKPATLGEIEDALATVTRK